MCDFLYREFGHLDKTVILANTEADNKLLDIMNYTGSARRAVDNLRAWTQTRFEAVSEARRANRGARLRVLHAFEISLVNLQFVKQGSMYHKTARVRQGERGWNALQDIVPHVSFDLLSYSAYEATNSPYETQRINVDAALTGQRLERDVRRIRKRAASSVSETGRRRFGRDFVMIGELGYPRERFDALPTGGVLPRLRSALAAARPRAVPTLCCGRFSTTQETATRPGASACWIGWDGYLDCGPRGSLQFSPELHRDSSGWGPGGLAGYAMTGSPPRLTEPPQASSDSSPPP